MKVTPETLPNRQVQLTVELDDDRTQEALRQTARKLARRMRIPGFRPGRAPYPVVLSTVGEEYLRAEALDTVGQELYDEALTQAGVEAYAQGTLEDVTWDPLTFKVTVPLAPEAHLGDYLSLRVSKQPVLVLDEDVSQKLDELRERHAEWVPVERAAAYGDMLIMDITGAVGDEQIIDQQNWERILQAEGSGSLPGFDDALVGLCAGEEKAFDIVYPDDAPSWSGQTAHFQVTVHAVKAKELPELDDEFAQDAGEFESLEELQNALRDQLRQEREAEADYEGQALDALVDQATIDYPPVALERELEELLEERERLFKRSGMPLADFLRVSGKSREEYTEELRPEAERRLRRSLALSQFVEDEKVAVLDADVEKEIEARVERQPEDAADRLRELLESPSGRRTVRNQVLTQKALDRLVSIAQGQHTPSDMEDDGGTETPADAQADAAVEPGDGPAEGTPEEPAQDEEA